MKAIRKRMEEITEEEEMSYSPEYVRSLVKHGYIHSDVLALDVSIEKHRETLNLLQMGFTPPKEAYATRTCPMCQWIMEKNQCKELEIDNNACPLAGRSGDICDGGHNCCDGLWRELYGVVRISKEEQKLIEKEQKLIDFLELRLTEMKGERKNPEPKRGDLLESTSKKFVVLVNEYLEGKERFRATVVKVNKPSWDMGSCALFTKYYFHPYYGTVTLGKAPKGIAYEV